jgi:DNA-binding IclR family transcriptional regulator
MDYHIPSVALAVRALKLLSRHKYQSCSLTDIAAKLEASPTTCLRVLRTLEADDLVRYDPDTKQYRLGAYLIPLGNRAAELNGVVASASAEIKRIAAHTRLTTVLIQRWDDRMVFIASAEPPAEQVRLSIAAGQELPMTSGAHGRCFLAYEDDAEVRRLIGVGIRPVTPATITDPRRLLVTLREVRRNGYAISHGELAPGFSAVDVPILDAAGRAALVISSMYVSSQMDEDHLSDLIAVLRGVSRRLSARNEAAARGPRDPEDDPPDGRASVRPYATGAPLERATEH